MKISIGIGAALAVFGSLLIFVSFSSVLVTSPELESPHTTLDKIPEISLYIEDARLAQLQTYYYEDNDTLRAILIFTDTDGEHTKANGHVELRVLDENRIDVYSNDYDFTKDDFISWQNNFGAKITGYTIDIDKYFPFGSHDVYVDIVTKNDKRWNDLHSSFYSLDD